MLYAENNDVFILREEKQNKTKKEFHFRTFFLKGSLKCFINYSAADMVPVRGGKRS